jgi:hypothetical protein
VLPPLYQARTFITGRHFLVQLLQSVAQWEEYRGRKWSNSHQYNNLWNCLITAVAGLKSFHPISVDNLLQNR